MQNVALLTFWKPYRRIQVDLPAEELVTDNQNCANVALQCCWASSCVLGINPYLPCFPDAPKDRLSLYPFIILFFISIPNKPAWRFPSFVPSRGSFSGTSISTISLCLKQAHQAWRTDSLDIFLHQGQQCRQWIVVQLDQAPPPPRKDRKPPQRSATSLSVSFLR